MRNRVTFVFKILASVLLLTFTFTWVATAEDAQNNGALKEFIGHWHSDNDTFGQPATSTIDWTSTLGGKFIRLDYDIKSKSIKNHPSMFTGVAYYKQITEDSLTAYWADSSGDLHPISATLEDRKVVSIWGRPGEKLGRTHYELISEDQLEVTDWIMKDGDWRQFNQNVFTRITKNAGS